MKGLHKVISLSLSVSFLVAFGSSARAEGNRNATLPAYIDCRTKPQNGAFSYDLFFPSSSEEDPEDQGFLCDVYQPSEGLKANGEVSCQGYNKKQTESFLFSSGSIAKFKEKLFASASTGVKGLRTTRTQKGWLMSVEFRNESTVSCKIEMEQIPTLDK